VGLASGSAGPAVPPGRAVGSGPLPLVVVATKAKRELFGEVQVRSAAVPQGEWTPEQAQALLGQGYSVDRVAALTGYDRRWLAAQVRPRAGS